MLYLFLHGVPAVPPLLDVDAAVDRQVGLGAPPVTVPGDSAQANTRVHPSDGEGNRQP